MSEQEQLHREENPKTDAEEVGELGSVFFADAIVTCAGESLIESVARARINAEEAGGKLTS